MECAARYNFIMSVNVGMCGRRFNEYNGRDRDVKMRATPSFPLLKNPVRRSLSSSLPPSIYISLSLPPSSARAREDSPPIHTAHCKRRRSHISRTCITGVRRDVQWRRRASRMIIGRVYYRRRTTEVGATIKWNITLSLSRLTPQRLFGYYKNRLREESGRVLTDSARERERDRSPSAWCKRSRCWWSQNAKPWIVRFAVRVEFGST